MAFLVGGWANLDGNHALPGLAHQLAVGRVDHLPAIGAPGDTVPKINCRRRGCVSIDHQEPLAGVRSRQVGELALRAEAQAVDVLIGFGRHLAVQVDADRATLLFGGGIGELRPVRAEGPGVIGRPVERTGQWLVIQAHRVVPDPRSVAISLAANDLAGQIRDMLRSEQEGGGLGGRAVELAVTQQA